MNNKCEHSTQYDEENMMTSSSQWTIKLATARNEIPVVVSTAISVTELLQVISDKTNISADGMRVLYRGTLIEASARKACDAFEDGGTVQITGEPRVPNEIRDLWTEVGDGVEKPQTIVWKKSVESLEAAKYYFLKDYQARRFVYKYLSAITAIMLDQSPNKVGPDERVCICLSLNLAAEIISLDLQSHGSFDTQKCSTVECLAPLFDSKKKAVKDNPTTRAAIVSSFKLHGGFTSLATYMAERVGLDTFPDAWTVASLVNTLNDEAANLVSLQDKAAAVAVVKSCIDHVSLRINGDLKYVTYNIKLSCRMFKALAKATGNEAIATDLKETDFFDLWSSLVLRMIDTTMPMDKRQKGWRTCYDLMEWSAMVLIKPDTVTVKGAGLYGVDGLYKRSEDVLYGISTWTRIIPDGFGEVSGTTLTLFRCTMKHGNKQWFISIVDEEQPGTDRDVDLYQCKVQSLSPPSAGWAACKGSTGAFTAISPTLEISQDVNGEQVTHFLPHKFLCWAHQNYVFEKIKSDVAHRNYAANAPNKISILTSILEFGQSQTARKVGLCGQATIKNMFQEMTKVTSEVDKAFAKFDRVSFGSTERKSATEAFKTILRNLLTMSEDNERKEVENCVLQQQLAERPGGDQLMRAAGFRSTQVAGGDVAYGYGGSDFELLSAISAVSYFNL